MNHPKAIDPRDRHTAPDPKAARREMNRIARAKRETPEEYAARVIRDLEIKEEYSEDYEEL
jgi:hypothetical protein